MDQQVHHGQGGQCRGSEDQAPAGAYQSDQEYRYQEIGDEHQ
jgi:hypothetical protein